MQSQSINEPRPEKVQRALLSSSPHALSPSSSPTPQARFQASPVSGPPTASSSASYPFHLPVQQQQQQQRQSTNYCRANFFTSPHSNNGAPIHTVISSPPLAHLSSGDHSILSTRSVASATTVTPRIEVRNVAELVRQLAESRYTARQLQQRMQQLENLAALDSLHEATQNTETLQGNGADAKGKEDNNLHITRRPPPPANTDSSLTRTRIRRKKVSQQDQRLRNCGTSRQRQTTQSHKGNASNQQTAAASFSSSNTGEGNSTTPFSRSVSASSNTSTLLTSTSTFLSTGASSSNAKSSNEFLHGEARRNASASSFSSFSKTSTSPLRQGTMKREACGHHHRRSQSAQFHYVQNLPSTSKSGTPTSGVNELRSANAMVRSSTCRSRRHSEEMKKIHRDSSVHHSPHRRTSKAIRQCEGDGDMAANAAASVVGWTPSANTRSLKHRHTSHYATKPEQRNQSRHRTRHPHQHHNRDGRGLDATSLSERRRLHQEAKELKRARQWQKRYYDLMTKYLNETAQRDAELADIHDLIEYMSWEQDRARRLHTPHAAAPAITEARKKHEISEEENNKNLKQLDEQEYKLQQYATPTRQETRGTAPQHSTSSPQPVSTRSEEAAKYPEGVVADQKADACDAQDTGTCLPKRRDDQTELRQSQQRAVTNLQSEVSGDGTCDGSREKANEAPHSNDFKRTEAVSEAQLNTETSAAVTYVQSLRSEAEAWRQRCLALLQQQHQQTQLEVNTAVRNMPPSESQDVTRVGTVLPDTTSSFGAVPSPLPPRPQQQVAPHVGKRRAPVKTADLVTSFTSAATPRTWEMGYGKAHTHGNDVDEDGVYEGSEAPLSTESSTPPTLSSLPYDRSLQPQRSQHHAKPNIITTTTSSSRSCFANANPQVPVGVQRQEITHQHQHQHQQQYFNLREQHRYAPSPIAPSFSAHLSKEATRRHSNATTAALHSLCLATEQRRAELSPLPPSVYSPPRPPLFVGLPGYYPTAEVNSYFSMSSADVTASAAGLAASSVVSPAGYQQQPYNVPEGWEASPYGATQSHGQNPATSLRHTLPNGVDGIMGMYEGKASCSSVQDVSSRISTEGGGVAWRRQQQQQQFIPPQPYSSSPPLMSTWSALNSTGNPLLQTSTHQQQHQRQQYHCASLKSRFSSCAPELFQTVPPSSSAASAELVVAREQLERDIRRHDQLLAAIGKLQKTASEHASRQ